MKGSNAFTLTELIVAVIIFTLTLLALFATYEAFYRTSKQQIARTITSEKLRPAIEQLERIISDTGFGISKGDLENKALNTSVMPSCGSNIAIGGLTACIDNNGLESETNNENYNYPLQLFSKSVVGNNPYSGNYFVYDDKIVSTSNIENYLIDLFGLPSSNFRTVVLDLNKNALQKNQLINELSINNLSNGNIIFIGRKIDEPDNKTEVEAYYYLKKIELSHTIANNDKKKYSICNPNTRNIQITNINPGNNRDSLSNPIITCVAYFNADFGCYDGRKIKWQRDICKKVKDIKLVRLGLIVQSGFINKELQYHGDKPTLTFPSLGRTGTNNTPVQYALKIDDTNIKNDQRYYKWEIIERIISTPNLNY
jgi:type II secretory pathway pseudopilin PulG